MQIEWMPEALEDLDRLYEFRARASESLAKHIVQLLINAPSILAVNPRIGERLDQYDPREVRRIFPDQYEMWYEVKGKTLFILRLWHTRENR